MRLYSIKEHHLIVVRTSDGAGIYFGKPEGNPVDCVVGIPHSDDCIVLFDYGAFSETKARNLVRLSAQLKVLWRAELPPEPGTDAFVAVMSTERGIEANTWSGYRVLIDISSGRIAQSEFVK